MAKVHRNRRRWGCIVRVALGSWMVLLALAAAGLGLAACTAVAEQAPAPAVARNAPPLPAGLVSAGVERVVDGDTVVVRLDGVQERVRLIGIDTPESVDPRRPVECFGREAAVHARALLDGRTVLLETDPTQGDRDRFGRLLRYLWLPDGRLFNLAMIAEGYAFEYTFRTPYLYQEQFQQAERDAREAQRGLWSPATCNGEARPAE